MPEVFSGKNFGSGTTAVAALETGRFFVGFETDERYFKAANERIGKIIGRADTEFAQKLGVVWVGKRVC